MKKANYIALAFLLTLLYVCTSCEKDDHFSENSNLRLTFSADTISLDTIFTEESSATKRFKIYNPNKNAIHISQIDLTSGGRSGFTINVDGENVMPIENVDIWAKDSALVSVELNPSKKKESNLFNIQDSIRIKFNGITQYVRLEAVGMQATRWRKKTIKKDTVLTDTKPFLIYDTLTIAEGATLTIKENVKIYFHDKACLKIEGTIKALGSVAKPITLRGDRLDNLFETPKVPYDRVPGQWEGVYIASNSYDNVFNNVKIRNARYGLYFEASQLSQNKALLQNSIIQNVTNQALRAENCLLKVENCLFSNSGSSTVWLVGGSYQFLHCTIANYMSRYWGVLRKPALMIANEWIDDKGKKHAYDLINTRFINTIVAGSSNAEVKEEPTKEYLFDRKYINCALKTNGKDDVNFVETIWKLDPKFKFIYSAETADKYPDKYYYYDFKLSPQSPAIGKASKQYSINLPFDIEGNSRLADLNPDIGCYEWSSN